MDVAWMCRYVAGSRRSKNGRREQDYQQRFSREGGVLVTKLLAVVYLVCDSTHIEILCQLYD